MIVTTLDKVEGHRISKTLKPVTGSVVMDKWDNFPVSKVAKYANMIVTQREKAITKMKDQARKYDLPQNPKKPGQYQWEALEHKQAKEIILNSVEKYYDKKAIDRVKENEERIENKARKLLKNSF